MEKKSDFLSAGIFGGVRTKSCSEIRPRNWQSALSCNVRATWVGENLNQTRSSWKKCDQGWILLHPVLNRLLLHCLFIYVPLHVSSSFVVFTSSCQAQLLLLLLSFALLLSIFNFQSDEIQLYLFQKAEKDQRQRKNFKDPNYVHKYQRILLRIFNTVWYSWGIFSV